MQNPKQVRPQGFEAEFKYDAPKSFYNERLVGGADHRGKLYVDRFGREREETFVLHNAKWELTFIYLWDVIALKASTLIPAEKKILTQETIDLKVTQRSLSLGMSGVISLALPRHSLPGGKDLGTKQIEGLTCKGVAISSPGNKERPGFAVECWYSNVISYVVFVKAVFGGTALENTFRLSNIRLVEPAEDLFTVPADYKLAKLVPFKN